MSAIKGVDYCIVHFDHFLVSISNIFFLFNCVGNGRWSYEKTL